MNIVLCYAPSLHNIFITFYLLQTLRYNSFSYQKPPPFKEASYKTRAETRRHRMTQRDSPSFQNKVGNFQKILVFEAPSLLALLLCAAAASAAAANDDERSFQCECLECT